MNYCFNAAHKIFIHHFALHLSGVIGTTKPTGYAENPDNWIFFFQISYVGSFKFKKKASTNAINVTQYTSAQSILF